MSREDKSDFGPSLVYVRQGKKRAISCTCRYDIHPASRSGNRVDLPRSPAPADRIDGRGQAHEDTTCMISRFPAHERQDTTPFPLGRHTKARYASSNTQHQHQHHHHHHPHAEPNPPAASHNKTHTVNSQQFICPEATTLQPGPRRQAYAARCLHPLQRRNAAIGAALYAVHLNRTAGQPDFQILACWPLMQGGIGPDYAPASLDSWRTPWLPKSMDLRRSPWKE